MMHVWIFSVLAVSLFLPGCSAPAILPLGQAQASNASLSAQTSDILTEPLTPTDRKAMEDLARTFGQTYYTYTAENYLQVNQSLFPLLTSEYLEKFKRLTQEGFTAAQAVKAASEVKSVQIISVDKLSPTQGKIEFQFQAQVCNNGKTTENVYSTTLDLRKQDGTWKINAILSEQPVEFLDIQKLL